MSASTSPSAGARSVQSAWNVDVVGSYTFRSALAFYGRVGYAMPDAGIATPAPLPAFVDARGLPRDGVNYGLGVRYDFTRAFGLNLEYTRFGRFADESFGGTDARERPGPVRAALPLLRRRRVRGRSATPCPAGDKFAAEGRLSALPAIFARCATHLLR